MTDREYRLGLMLMKMREAWWPFVHSAGFFASNRARGLLKESADVLSEDVTPVIDMVLYCPNCGKQHIDAPDTEPCKDECQLAKDYGFSPQEGHSCSKDCGYMQEGSPRWTNPPHRSHLCHHCGCIWRPADVPTNGVAVIETKGKADTWVGKAAFAAPADSTQAEAQIVATFETSSEGLTGTVSARVKRVERHDDGTLEVIIDHWPARPERT